VQDREIPFRISKVRVEQERTFVRCLSSANWPACVSLRQACSAGGIGLGRQRRGTLYRDAESGAISARA